MELLIFIPKPCSIGLITNRQGNCCLSTFKRDKYRSDNNKCDLMKKLIFSIQIQIIVTQSGVTLALL